MSEVQRYAIKDGWLVADENGKVVSYEAYAALQKKLDAVLAESAARGEIVERLIGQYSCAGYHAVQNSLNPAQSLLYDAMQVQKPGVTWAILNAVRAEGVDMLVADKVFEWMDSYREDAHKFANKLRAGNTEGATHD